MLLVEEIYRLTAKFPTFEMMALTDQMRRASMSIPSNIAEGQYRFSTTQNRQYLRVAYGSCAELDTHIAIAQQLHYLTPEDVQTAAGLLDEVMRMLNSMLKRKLESL